jgi:hypothetical protein
MLTKSKKFNPNYAAQIVQLKNKVNHPNADRLIGWIVQGCRVWTSLDYKEGDICIFFPIECQINKDLLSQLNMFRNKDLNIDKNKSGLFCDKGRVKALKIRQEPSEGFLLKIETFKEALFKISIDKNLEYEIGDIFDEACNVSVCRKYVIRESRNSNGSNKEKKIREKFHLVENQFRLHYDTEKLATCEYLLNPGDICVILDKWHGTNLVSSKVLVERKLTWLEKIAKFFGCKVQESEYDYVFSSRKVIKRVGETNNEGQSFYKENIWHLAHETIKHALIDGMSMYCEIVGYTPDGSMIQKDYDYGCRIGEFKVFVYRITTTNVNGDVFEWDWASIKNYCEKFGIMHAVELYYGPIQFTLEQLKEKYLENDCVYCNNKVPAEGIILRNESINKIAKKLKAFRFFEKETKQLDTGEVDIETQESEE